MFILWLLSITPIKIHDLKFTILYEKVSCPGCPHYYTETMGSFLDRYNKILEKHALRLRILDILSFHEYESKKKYENLVDLAGSDNITNRAKELLKIADMHYILGASTANYDKKGIEYIKIDDCRSVYVFNMDSIEYLGRDVPLNLQKAFLNLISNIFGVTFPHIKSRMQNDVVLRLEESLKKSEKIINFKECKKIAQYGILNDSFIDSEDLDIEDMEYKDFPLINNETVIKECDKVLAKAEDDEKLGIKEGKKDIVGEKKGIKASSEQQTRIKKEEDVVLNGVINPENKSIKIKDEKNQNTPQKSTELTINELKDKINTLLNLINTPRHQIRHRLYSSFP